MIIGLPTELALEEIDHRDAVVVGVVGRITELAAAAIIDLRNLLQEGIAGSLAHPEHAVGIDVHLGIFKLLQKGSIAAQDVEHLLHLAGLRERIAVVASPREHIIVVISAEGLAADHLHLIPVCLAQHFHQDAALHIGGLADADVTR